MEVRDVLVNLSIDTELFDRVNELGVEEYTPRLVLSLDAAEIQLVTGTADWDPAFIAIKSRCFPGYGCTSADVRNWHDVLIFSGDMQKAAAHLPSVHSLVSTHLAPYFIEAVVASVGDLMELDIHRQLLARQYALWNLKYHALIRESMDAEPLTDVDFDRLGALLHYLPEIA